jgi:hypothetical protein
MGICAGIKHMRIAHSMEIVDESFMHSDNEYF